MAAHPLSAQIAAVRRAVEATPRDNALAAALTTLKALSFVQPVLEDQDWSPTGDERDLERLTRAMEGLMP